MTDPYEVIAAFADGERVDPAALKQALSEPAGRDYLVDLLALREAVQVTGPEYATVARVRRPRLRWLAAAALLVVIGGGALFFTTRDSDRPPTPNHVVKLERGLDWRGN